MITQAVMEFVVFGLIAVTALIPGGWATSAFFVSGGTMDSAMNSVVASMVPLGGWVPFSAASNVVALMLTCFTVGTVFKLIKLALRSITGGGTPE